MRRFSDAEIARAPTGSRAARAEQGRFLATLRARLGLESPIGIATVYLLLSLVIGGAVFQEHVIAFTLKIAGLIGLTQPQSAAFDTAEIVFTPVDGNSCRKVLFSNRSGHFSPDLHVRCDTREPSGPDMTSTAGLRPGTAPRLREELVVLPDSGTRERMSSIRAAFTARVR